MEQIEMLLIRLNESGINISIKIRFSDDIKMNNQKAVTMTAPRPQLYI